MKIYLVILQITSMIHLLTAAPFFGPSQRNKMHRLMHAPGANMDKEDHVRMKKDEKEGERRGAALPIDQETYLHKVGMHGDIKSEAKHDKKEPSKANNQAQGPCQGMDCLHGVLMHNDGEQGHDHGEEDAKMRKARGKDGVASVQDPHEMVHGHHKSIAEAAENEKAERKANERKNKKKRNQEGPDEILEFDDKRTTDGGSYWDSLKRFFGFSSNEEEKKDDSLSMDMMHDLEGVGKVGPLKHVHHHDKENPRLKREEHKLKAHREH